MAFLKALGNLFRRADKAAADAIANPVGDAEIAIEDAEREIVTITKSIAAYMAEKRKIEKMVPSYKADIKKYQGAAEKALDLDKDDLASDALERKNESKSLLDDAEKRLTIMESDIAKMRNKLAKYKKMVRDAKVNHKKLAATDSMNKARAKLNDASAQFDKNNNSFSALGKLEEQVATQEATMDAMDELTADPSEQLDDLIADAGVSDELAALKAKRAKKK